MLKGRRILAVVPARGGSKGVPLKNLQPVAGRPLVARAGAVVAALDCIDRGVVSTDHLLIRDAAMASGLDAPFLRPPALSGDSVGDVAVLEHALTATEADDGHHYDVVLMLQPTSPLRRPEHVLAVLHRLLDGDLDSVWTVSPTDLKAHPLKQLEVDGDGALGYHHPQGASIIARQQLTPTYHRNGVAYALTRECLLEQRRLLGTRAGTVVMDEPLVNIDTAADLATADALLRDALPPPPPPAARPRRLVVDIDGVLAAAALSPDYGAAEPLWENIRRVNALHDAGCEIILHTARGSATGLDWADTTRAQLARWGVRYHELILDKPHADVYVDDRLMTLAMTLALCGIPDPQPIGVADDDPR